MAKNKSKNDLPKDINDLISTITYYGEDDGYFPLINDVLLPSMMAYFANKERDFGTVSDQEYLNQCQCLQLIMMKLREFTMQRA